MTEYMSFHELMKVVKDGDLVKNESSNRTALEFVDGILRHRGGAQSKYDYPWDFKYKIIKPKPEMIEMYIPKVVWIKGEQRPRLFGEGILSSRKDLRFWYPDIINTKVIEWETLTVPKNYKDLEHDS